MRRRVVTPILPRERILMIGGYALGTAYETVKNLGHGSIDAALLRGFEGGLEGLMIGSVSPVTRYAFRVVNDAINSRARPIRRFREATLRLLPVGALYGAAINGFNNYAFDNTGNPNYFPADWITGGAVGAASVGLPLLLAEGHRNGVYRAVRDFYVNANRGVYNFVNTRVSPLYGPVWGRIAGATSVVGANAAAGGTVYGVGRIAGLW